MNIVTDWLSRYLDAPLKNYEAVTTSSTGLMASILQPGDVLLVEGDRRISVAIKYLTQSTWSHAAIYVGNVNNEAGNDPAVLIEAEIEDGVVISPLSKYQHLHTRICRPHNLTEEDRNRLIAYLLCRIGHQYDMQNIFDLARYLLPTPPVPVHWRRRMIALGSGDPTRAICSTLIAEAFHTICYPILPKIEIGESDHPDLAEQEIMHIRHHSLFTPRDFDISPFFDVLKPSILNDFNYKDVNWGRD